MDQQLSVLPANNPLGYLNSTQAAQVLQVRMNRAPTTSDRRFKLGTIWTNTSTNNVYILTNVTSGDAIWESLGGPSTGIDTLTGNTGGAVSPVGSNIDILGNNLGTFVGTSGTLTYTPTAAGYPITPFVVGPSGQAGYQTIQSAINAANTAGGGIIYVQPGTYTENLTFFGNIQIAGTQAYENSLSTIISGIHTPPSTGNIALSNVELQSATHIFNSTAAGSGSISIQNSTFNITSGFIFNLPNWTGGLNINDCGELSANNGVLNNSAAAPFFSNNCQIGAGSLHTFISNGACRFDLTYLACPVTITSGSIFANFALFSATLTLAGNTNGTIFLGDFFTGATPSITMSSSGNVSVFQTTINSSNNPAISGSGAGTLTLGDITFLNNSSISGTLTLAYAASRFGVTNMVGNSNVTGSFTASTTLTATLGNITATNGNLVLNTAGNKIVSTSVGSGTSAGANSFGTVTLTGGTATVSTTSVTASSLIYLFRQGIGATGAAALGILTVGTITGGSSFVINSVQAADATALQASDVSSVGWMIVN